MARFTNLGFKRTYVDAGLDVTTSDPSNASKPEAAPPDPSTSKPPKKKRKRSRPAKAKETSDSIEENAAPKDEVADSSKTNGKPTLSVAVAVVSERTPRQKRRDREKWEKERRKKALEARKQEQQANQPEIRRLKRKAEKAARTTCFACRETGHAAKDCTTTRNADSTGSGDTVVGICYRCGSSKHTLSRCKTAVDVNNPMPFASCFVCSKKGHLASGCPLNKDKGVYPNGGCCKICGETTHLARDCGLRKKDDVAQTTVLGVGDASVGADEDDFHILKRRKAEVEDEEQKEKRSLSRKPLEGSKSGGDAASMKRRRVVNF